MYDFIITAVIIPESLTPRLLQSAIFLAKSKTGLPGMQIKYLPINMRV